jgi:hypothetical protein
MKALSSLSAARIDERPMENAFQSTMKNLAPIAVEERCGSALSTTW